MSKNRNRNSLKFVTDNSSYRKALNNQCSCSFCGLGKGCNRSTRYQRGPENWKNNRNNQWKNLEITKESQFK